MSNNNLHSIFNTVCSALAPTPADDDMLHVGDEVMWRGGFGAHAPLPARVIGIEKTDLPNQKEGSSVESIAWKDIACSVIDLDTGNWAYGDQISKKI